MGWQVHGTEIEFSAASNLFSSQETSGLTIEGKGMQCMTSPASTGVDLKQLRELEGHWSLHRATAAAPWSGVLGLANRELVPRIDWPAVVKTTTKPISFISYYAGSDNGDASIGFTTFLPDADFSDAWELMKLIVLGAPLRYWLSYDFLGFLPRRLSEDELRSYSLNPSNPPLSYSDWLAGSPYCSETFSLRIVRREPEGTASRSNV